MYGLKAISYLAALPPLFGSITFIHLEDNPIVWLNYHTYVKKKKETFMVEEPSHVQQQFPTPRV